MDIQAFFLTLPRRYDVLRQTLASLRQSDWQAEPHIVMDNEPGDMIANAHRLLCLAEATKCDYCLFLEDDVTFNRHLKHNLEAWPRLGSGQLIFGTLYHPDRDASHCQPSTLGEHECSYPMQGHYCSQALLIHRSVLPLLIERWYDPMFTTEWQDVRIHTLLSPTVPTAWAYVPDLVQHRTEPSTWGGGQHTTPYFDKDFRR